FCLLLFIAFFFPFFAPSSIARRTIDPPIAFVYFTAILLHYLSPHSQEQNTSNINNKNSDKNIVQTPSPPTPTPTTTKTNKHVLHHERFPPGSDPRPFLHIHHNPHHRNRQVRLPPRAPSHCPPTARPVFDPR
ncbi:hypothetical protein F5H01DRAFT_377763, partial [Linnemannia elongata]